MDPIGGLVGQLAGLPWLLAFVVGGTAAAVTIVVAHAIRNGSWTPPEQLAAIGRGALHRFRSVRGTPTGTRWLCATCRSWNRAEAAACYRGCGPRELCGMPLPTAGEGAQRDEAAPAPQVGGRPTRRG
jgi:hypothetical protein